MKPHFVLVDFENVQPKSLAALQGGQHQVRVFLGASQTKISLELAQSLQAFGPDAKYVQVSGNGSNALDFHIAFYIGRLSAQHPGATFTIVSKDTGFDPLVKHLAGKGIACRRSVAIGDAAKAVPPVKAPSVPKRTAARETVKAAPPDPRLAVVVENLGNVKSNRPRTVKTLGASVRSWFKPALDDTALAGLLEQLARAGRIRVDGTKVSYSLG